MQANEVLGAEDGEGRPIIDSNAENYINDVSRLQAHLFSLLSFDLIDRFYPDDMHVASNWVRLGRKGVSTRRDLL